MKALRLRPATREERQLAMFWSAAAASVLILRPVWIAIAPHLRGCALRKWTGIPCPTCGTTRTALSLLDFDPGSAFAVNPLAATAGVAFIAGGGLALVWVLLRWPLPTFGCRWTRRWTVVAIGLVLINWVYLIGTN